MSTLPTEPNLIWQSNVFLVLFFKHWYKKVKTQNQVQKI